MKQTIKEVVGLEDISTLDVLSQTYTENGTESVPTELVKKVLAHELGNKREIALSVSGGGSVSFDHIPDRLYFLLWTLKHSENVPLIGLVSSEELFAALAELAQNILLLNTMLKKGQKGAVVFEHLGLAYFDLAGIAHFSTKGVQLFKDRCSETQLLRRSVDFFQQAIKAETEQAKSFETNHSEILAAAETGSQLKENRTDRYLNPWLFLYTASALLLLNDNEAVALYLKKAESIIKVLSEHQNARVRGQKTVIDAVYRSLFLGNTANLDFEKAEIQRIDRRRRRLRDRNSGKNSGMLSSLTINALLQEKEVQKALIEERVVTPEQVKYLQSVSTIYQEVPKGVKRDRLIFRLNMPPLRIKGLQTLLRDLVERNPDVLAYLPEETAVSVN